jgi:hypothetical protein
MNLVEKEDSILNSFIVHSLVDLKAVEALPEIELAFASDIVVDRTCGGWEKVQKLLGVE